MRHGQQDTPEGRELRLLRRLLRECLTRLRYAGHDHAQFVALLERRWREGIV